MRPKTISASSLNVAQLCMLRYKAENIDRGARIENDAASLGTVCHGALEAFVKFVHLDKTGPGDLGLLEMFYRIEYGKMFGGFEEDDEMFQDGLQMIRRWFKRTEIAEDQVISCEVKSSFPVKTSIGNIGFTYIWDRCDQTGPDEVTVVDYKSSRLNVTPEGLRQKLQARAYAVAAQIQFPHAKKIWVKFDMLRYDVVGTVFTIEENRETYKYIKQLAERIIAEDDPKPSLNDECRFCILRQTCPAVLSNTMVGGLASLHGLPDADLADMRANLDFQIKSLKQNLGEMDKLLLVRAKEQDLTVLEGGVADAQVAVYGKQVVDPDRVRMIVGDKIFLRYGGVDIGIGKIREMLKDSTIPEEHKAQVRGMIYTDYGNPYIKSTKRGNF